MHYSGNSDVTRKIKTSFAYNNLVSGWIYQYKTYGTRTFPGTNLEFNLNDVPDLYYSIHGCAASGQVQDDGTLLITITDVYDFTKLVVPYPFTKGALANDYGVVEQNIGALEPFNITIYSYGTIGNSTISTIQSQLNVMTNAGLPVDGIEGSQTLAKIEQFQQIVGITVDGIWGTQCANATAQIYAEPLCGVAYTQPVPTRLIQFRMGIAIDGVFGTNTATSVKAWQSAHGLNPDGVFGPQSWGKLL